MTEEYSKYKTKRLTFMLSKRESDVMNTGESFVLRTKTALAGAETLGGLNYKELASKDYREACIEALGLLDTQCTTS
jgi:hypothetical protein